MDFIKQITPKGWIAIAVVIIVIILIIYLVRKPKTITTTTTTMVPAAIVPISSGNGFPLQMGSRGTNVAKWQKYLNTKGASLKEDEIWGPLTEAASLKYMGFNSVTEEYFNTVIK